MTDNEEKRICVKFLQNLKVKGKQYPMFEESFSALQNYAATKGLEDEDIDLLVTVIMKTDLGATKLVSLIKCLVPKYKLSKDIVNSIVAWCLSSIDKIPITVSTIILQWIIGILDNHLIDKRVVNIFYSVFFHIMLRKEKVEKHIARLIYVLAKPEDVTRRDVIRLLNLQQKYSKPQKHISILLSLFKSYKPELVPEKIQSVNVESVWKSIPESLQLMLEDAKIRSEIQQREEQNVKYINWNKFEGKKKAPPLLPSVGYFSIGSNIFKEKDVKSIFDIFSTEDLGKWNLSVELPCNAVSLLSNSAGYHLLTFADFQYQSRFSYNLYNTLMRALILENEVFSMEEINMLLDMTIEFSRYMQQGIPVVNRFLDEYLYLNSGEYELKLLALIQWMTSVSISDLQERILVHMKNMFYQSTVITKCEIIRTLKLLIINLFVTQGFEECCQNTPALFLGQAAMDNLKEIIPILTKTSEDIIISGLNTHSYNILLLSEALSFYEEICLLESRSNTVLSFTLAPPALIYGSFITKSYAILSRICKLLLRYHERCLQFQNTHDFFKNAMDTISVYAEDIIGTLWYDESFQEHSNKRFFKHLSKRVVNDLKDCNLNCHLNVSNHYAFLPYKCILSKSGLNIETKEDAMEVALHYYPAIYKFLTTFQNTLQ
ncbi:centromere protein I [Xylocopa sonorina]|uniref:centromere protein I n=1 Tax=Xylocopa sonorina TaxID=1818115 RepID=UPI00403B11FB